MHGIDFKTHSWYKALELNKNFVNDNNRTNDVETSYSSVYNYTH